VSAEDIYFTVSPSERVDDSLTAIAERAMLVDRVVEVRDTTRLMFNWLRADPESMGEPYRFYKATDLIEYIGFVGPLIVRYNLHLATKQVFIIYPVRVARWAGF
jgi:hypothetical protein